MLIESFDSMTRVFLIFGALAAGLAVVAGAFGAHALENVVTAQRLQTFETAVRYQMYHALALLLVGWMLVQQPATSLTWSAGLFAAGILIFSGSLYVLVLTDTPWLGAVTPIGGLAFIAGWSCLLWYLLTTRA